MPIRPEMVVETEYPYSVLLVLWKQVRDVELTNCVVVQADTPIRALGVKLIEPKLVPSKVMETPALVGELMASVTEIAGESYE